MSLRNQWSRAGQAGLAGMLALAQTTGAGCHDKGSALFIARCTVDDDCAAGKLCQAGACVPDDTVSCTMVQGGKAILQPNPPQIDFGSVSAETASRALDLKNIGSCTLTIFDAHFKGAAASPFACPACGAGVFPLELFPFRTRTLPVLFSPRGIGDASDTLVLSSDDADYPELDIPIRARFDGQPVVVASPPALDFGYVPAGARASQTVQISNHGSGDAPLQILAVTLDATATSAFSFAPALTAPVAVVPLSRDPKAGYAVNVRYAPIPAATPSATGIAAGPDRAALVVQTSAAGAPLRIPLSGSSAQPPRISISPPMVQFGSVPMGRATTQMLTIVNMGGAPLEVQYAWGGAGFTTDFGATPGAVPRIAPGDYGQLQLQVTPTAVGDLASILVVKSNDPMQPTAAIPVSATGAAVAGAQVVKIDLSYDQGSDAALSQDIRSIDVTLEDPDGLVCNAQSQTPKTWGVYGNPTWLSFGPKGDPKRIVLPDSTQDGTYRVSLSYTEDCSALPTGLLASLLGVSGDVLIAYLTGGAVSVDPGTISKAIDQTCLKHDGAAATVSISVNGQVVSEKPVRLGKKGDAVRAAEIVRTNGQYTVR